jgi:hypothetical protein
MNYKYNSNSGGAKYGCGCIILILLISAAIGSVCWTYSLNTWLVFFNKPASIVWWQGALLGFCPYLGQASLPFAVITWILMLFL